MQSILRRLSTSAQNSLEKMRAAGIIPDVIKDLPKEICKIKYPSGVTVDMGNKLTPTQVKDQPSVSWNAQPKDFYLLCMTDPDAPSRANPEFREWHHWLVGNIPGCVIDDGEVLSAYVGSGPPENTDYHRYVFLVYKQKSKLNFHVPRLTPFSGDGRAKFSISEFAKNFDLTGPIAGNFYLAKWDEYVPQLYKQLGC